MANFNLNKVILGGRMTADPELKQTPQGVSVTSFSLAVNRKAQKDKETQNGACDRYGGGQLHCRGGGSPGQV